MVKANSQQSELDKIAASITRDKICPQLAESATQLVPGEGDAAADIVFIGEAPGRDEDAQGRPFVGAAGKLLTAMIEGIGLKRAQVYITNIVKYRPPNNRDPQPEEIKAFMPYLLKQLAVIKPKLIVLLGRHAMSVFLPELRISQCHGQPKRKGGLVFMPLYHPAVALYNGSMRTTLEEDFAKLPKVLKLIKSQPSAEKLSSTK